MQGNYTLTPFASVSVTQGIRLLERPHIPTQVFAAANTSPTAAHNFVGAKLGLDVNEASGHHIRCQRILAAEFRVPGVRRAGLCLFSRSPTGSEAGPVMSRN